MPAEKLLDFFSLRDRMFDSHLGPQFGGSGGTFSLRKRPSNCQKIVDFLLGSKSSSVEFRGLISPGPIQIHEEPV